MRELVAFLDITSTHQVLDLATFKVNSHLLSQLFWKLKENNTDHTVTWKILEKAQPYSPITGKCNLCTSEKAYIAYTHPSLNKRRELFSTCPHRRKHLLSNLKIISEEKQASNGNEPSGSAPRPSEGDGRKCPAAKGL